jgi:polyhydroxybutyrate depolymerase
MSATPKRLRRTAVTAVAIIAIAIAGGVFRRQAEAAEIRDRSNTIQVGGRTRSYLLHVLPNYNATIPVPLVLVLHGATQSPASAERMSGMSELADREGFLVAYPSGTSRFGRMPTWNAGNCCGYALNNNIDDVGFVRALIEKLKRDYNVDPKRIYVTGISNGGMLSYRLACELADQVAAVAPVEGAQNVDCHPSAAVSVIIFHGTADRLVPFEGGSTPFQLGPRRSDTPVKDAVAFWVKQDGCSPNPKHDETKEVQIDTYSGCGDGTGVALYAIQRGHHMWPGTRLSRNNVAATEIMWRFFTDHPKK